MAVLAPVITQTVSGSVTITCTGSKNTYVSFSDFKHRMGNVKQLGSDTGYRGDTIAPYPAFSPSASIVTTAGARPYVGVMENRIGDSITTITVAPGLGISVRGYGVDGHLTHSSDATGGTLNLVQWWIVW